MTAGRTAPDTWSRWLVIGLGAWLALGALYLFMGQANADEGWYLYAARLVREGRLPYRDFALTQMPLVPALHALAQSLLPAGLYAGRAVSLLCAFIGVLACVALARGRSGERGAALTALLLATFTFGVYFTVIVKTYAVLFLLFSVTALALSSRRPGLGTCVLAIVLAWLAAMTRLAAVAFFVPVALYALAVSRGRPARLFALLLLCAVLAAGAVGFALAAPEAARWGLVTHHLSHWGDLSATDRALRIVGRRIPHLLWAFAPYVALAVALGALAKRDPALLQRARDGIRRNGGLAAAALGIAGFTLAHLGTGAWHIEYFVPGVMALLPLLAVLSAKWLERPRDAAARRWMYGAMALALVAPPLTHRAQHIDDSGGSPPIAEIRAVAAQLSARTAPDDSLFVLEALWLAVESGRPVLPGMTMAQFSFQDMSRERCRRLGLVNPGIATDYLQSGRAGAVALTDLDWEMFRRSGCDAAVRAALGGRYERVLEREAFGQNAGRVTVYLRRREREPELP